MRTEQTVYVVMVSEFTFYDGDRNNGPCVGLFPKLENEIDGVFSSYEKAKKHALKWEKLKNEQAKETQKLFGEVRGSKIIRHVRYSIVERTIDLSCEFDD